MEHGVNYFDMADGHAAIFDAYGKALEGKRDQVYLQIHFGADYTSGEYGWTTSLKKIKESVRWQMENSVPEVVGSTDAVENEAANALVEMMEEALDSGDVTVIFSLN